MAFDPNHEIDPSKLTRDTRSVEAKVFQALLRPTNFPIFLLGFIALQLYVPALWPVWSLVALCLVTAFKDQRFQMPLRMPKDLGGLDRTDFREELEEPSFPFSLIGKSRTIRKLMFAGGLLYLGHLRSPDLKENGRELWLTNSDARTHMLLSGTTGSGKSESLLAISFNALCWGSGVCYGDGKADSKLPFSLWSLSRRLGREDDFLILNYLTGGMDPFQRIVERETGQLSLGEFRPQSNSMNSFGEGSADFLLQLIASLIPTAHGDGAQWQEKALNMFDALLRTLCYKRAKGEMDTSIAAIRHYLALQNLVKLYLEGRDGKLPEQAFLPIKAYFETGLPGFNPGLAHDPSKWDPEVFNQHGYLTGQFARTLSMMMDTYGYIFSDKYPDIDLLDVLLNNRILVVMIPSLEKSAAEAASLGKLYISSIRLMMAQNLGYRLEGTRSEVLDAKATNAPNPYVIISDELSFYFAAGIAVMFAQARALGFMMVAGIQDVQGLKRGDAKDEAASMIANTKVKWTLALEDPEDTFQLIKKAGGEAHYSVLSGHDESTGTFSTSYKAQETVTIERRDRITMRDLKSLNEGEGFLIFKDAVLASKSFYIPDEEKMSGKLPARINRFVQVERPHISRIPSTAIRMEADKFGASDKIFAQFRLEKKPYYPLLKNPTLDSVVAAASQLNQITRFKVSPEERGIVLFETARRALASAEAAGLAAPYHEPRFDDPPELYPGDEDELPDAAFAD